VNVLGEEGSAQHQFGSATETRNKQQQQQHCWPGVGVFFKIKNKKVKNIL